MHKLTLHLSANSLHLTDDLDHGKAGTLLQWNAGNRTWLAHSPSALACCSTG